MKHLQNHHVIGEKLKAFLLKSGMRQRYPPSPLLLNIALEGLTTTNPEQWIKGKNWKQRKNTVIAL